MARITRKISDCEDRTCPALWETDDPELTLPHPRAHERAFVLAPWHDIDPDAEIPGWGQVSDLLAKADPAGIERLDDAVLHAPACRPW